MAIFISDLPALSRIYSSTALRGAHTSYFRHIKPPKKSPKAAKIKRSEKEIFKLNSTDNSRQGVEMCLVFVCDEDERVVGRQAAPGACPYCGGIVQALDVDKEWRSCFIPLYSKSKRKYGCTICGRRLLVQ